MPFTNGYVRPPWAKYLSGRRLPYSYATHDEASSHIGLSGQLLDTGRVWSAVPGNGGVSGRKASLAVTLRRLIRPLARDTPPSPSGSAGRSGTASAICPAVGGLAMNYLWAWRVQTGLLLNDRLREMRADMREIQRGFAYRAAWSSHAAAGLHRSDLLALVPAAVPGPRPHRALRAGSDQGRVAAAGSSYIAFEHATMRTLPFENTLQGGCWRSATGWPRPALSPIQTSLAPQSVWGCGTIGSFRILWTRRNTAPARRLSPTSCAASCGSVSPEPQDWEGAVLRLWRANR